MTTRESFAVEQLESPGAPAPLSLVAVPQAGAINAITKQATLDYDFTCTSFGFGNANFVRGTLDMNKILTDEFAIRANALFTDAGHPWPPGRVPQARRPGPVRPVGSLQGRAAHGRLLRAAHDRPDLSGYLVARCPTACRPRNVPVYAQVNDFRCRTWDTLTARLQWTIRPDPSSSTA